MDKVGRFCSHVEMEIGPVVIQILSTTNLAFEQ
jgi:hypothetical protein